MTRQRDELPDEEAALLGLEFQTEEQEEADRKRQQERADLRKLFLRSAMADPMFREWLFGLLQEFKTFENPFGNSPMGFPDPMATQFALGMKAAGWRLWETFDDVAPDLASLMRREGIGLG